MKKQTHPPQPENEKSGITDDFAANAALFIEKCIRTNVKRVYFCIHCNNINRRKIEFLYTSKNLKP